MYSSQKREALISLLRHGVEAFKQKLSPFTIYIDKGNGEVIKNDTSGLSVLAQDEVEGLKKMNLIDISLEL